MRRRDEDPRSPQDVVHLLKTRRRGEIHDVRDLEVSLEPEGERLAPDAARAAVLEFATHDPVDRIESFALALSAHVLERHPAITRVVVNVVEHEWGRVLVPGKSGREPHPNVFRDAGEDAWVTRVARDRAAATVESGLRDVLLLRATAEGPVWVAADARWTWGETPRDWATDDAMLRDALLGAFASAAHTTPESLAGTIGRALLERCPRVVRVTVALRPRHCEPAGESVHTPSAATEKPVEVTVER